MYNSFDSRGWLDTLPTEITSEVDIFMGDIRDPNGVLEAMTDIDTVYHYFGLGTRELLTPAPSAGVPTQTQTIRAKRP